MEKRKNILKKGLTAVLITAAAVLAVSIYCIVSGVHIADIFSARNGQSSMAPADLPDKADSRDAGGAGNSNTGSVADGDGKGTAVSGDGSETGATDEQPVENVTGQKEDDAIKPASGDVAAPAEESPVSAKKEDIPLELNIDDLTLVKGFKIRAVPVQLPSGAGKNLVWTSSDNTVASVDKNGNITGIGSGSAVITCAAASGDKKDTVNVTVIDLPGSGATGSDDAYKGKYIPKLASKEFSVANKDVNISNSRFSMKIPKGTLYANRIEEYMLKWMNLVEKASGLSFYPEGKNHPKVTITVHNSSGASGDFEGIWVSWQDIVTDDSFSAYTFTHELSHTLDYRNSGTNFKPFTEGFAIQNSFEAIKLLGRNDLAQVTAFLNFWSIPPFVSQLDNFEKYYSSVSGWDAYSTGYIFAFYLCQEYGDKILTDIMKKWGSVTGGKLLDNSGPELIRLIKESTSENVFLDFKDWYLENKSLYNGWDMLDNDLYTARGITETMCIPWINEDIQMFYRYKYDKVDHLLLDFYEAFCISQIRGFSAKGIFGERYSSTEATVGFYDADWNFICARELSAGKNSIEVWGAARMLVKGNGGYFNFDAQFEQMMEK